ncbi:HTH domain-containing protein [Staphylococcus equorum]|uniref:HTH domain-containing protein n=1 Tax=Staphylococcus equorum TaxID=246432 RepID=UPI003EBD49C0
MMKSISQLSTELNVSRTTIWNYLQNLPQNLSVIKEKNVYKIDIDVENFIRERLLKKSNGGLKGKEKEINVLHMEKDLLKKRIKEIRKNNEYLKRDISKKENLIEDLMILFKQLQKLQLDVNKELIEYKRAKD